MYASEDLADAQLLSINERNRAGSKQCQREDSAAFIKEPLIIGEDSLRNGASEVA